VVDGGEPGVDSRDEGKHTGRNDEGTSLGRLFHIFVPATGKARPPIVDRRQVGTSSCSVEADLSMRRCGMSATQSCE